MSRDPRDVGDLVLLTARDQGLSEREMADMLGLTIRQLRYRLRKIDRDLAESEAV